MRLQIPLRSIAASAAMLLSFGVFPAAAQQAEKALPSVSLTPTDVDRSDPNLGGWFVFQIDPGASVVSKARITNPADVPQHVKLYLADLVFAKNGTPEVVDGPQKDVGGWGRFLEPEITIPARGTVDSTFQLSVPKDAEPGDHVGVVVAESDPEPGGISVVKRVATRLYVTVPGDARKSMEIASIKDQVDSKFWPRRMLFTVVVRNTGRIRLHPKVTVRETAAKGSEVLLARSIEPYVAEVMLPWYGGRVRLPVEVTADSGLTRRVNATRIIVPWGLIPLLALIAGALYLLRRWWLARASRLAQLHADIRRLETLVTQRPAAPAPVSVESSESDEEIGAIIAGLKRAVRTRSQPSLERLALSLHETGEDAFEYLVEALRDPSETNRSALIQAAASYGPAAIASKGDLELPDDVGRALIAATTSPPKEKTPPATKSQPRKSSAQPKTTRKKVSAKAPPAKTSGGGKKPKTKR